MYMCKQTIVSKSQEWYQNNDIELPGVDGDETRRRQNKTPQTNLCKRIQTNANERMILTYCHIGLIGSDPMSGLDHQ